MVPTETKEIDGITFRVRALDLRAERSLLVRLAKVVGPAVTDLMQGGKEAMPDAISSLLNYLNESELDHLIDTFRAVTECKVVLANREQWVECTDNMFKRGFSSQLKWLWFCLEHQFGSFLGSGSGKLESFLESLLGKLKAAAAKASPSTSPQT